MNLKKFVEVNEEFATWKKGRRFMQRHTFGIYKNPTGNDIREIMKDEKPDGFRILIDTQNKNVYLFDKELLHMDALSSIKELKNIEARMIKEGMANTDREIVWMKGITAQKKREIKSWLSKKTVLTWT